MVFAIFYVLVWVSVEFFNKLDPVSRLVRERNNNMTEQHFSLAVKALCAKRHENDR